MTTGREVRPSQVGGWKVTTDEKRKGPGSQGDRVFVQTAKSELGDLDRWQQVELGQPVTVSAGSRLRDGSLLLADESGRLLRSTDEGRHFTALALQPGTGLTGIAEAADGALIISSARGLTRVEPDAIVAGVK